MKYKLLSVSKSPKLVGINIGDYIQALAAAQFYPHIDGFIDRDEDLKDYDGEPCKVIMNGWNMHNPENWPPSKKNSSAICRFSSKRFSTKGIVIVTKCCLFEAVCSNWMSRSEYKGFVE